MSNGFSAADMSTAAANGHAEGYQAGYADAVKAVEVGKPAAAQEAVAIVKIIGGAAHDFCYLAAGLADGEYSLFSAPVAAATVDSNGLILDLRAAVSIGRPLLHSDVDEIERALASTPAAPGIDLTPFRLLVEGCEAEYTSDVTERMEPDDSKVSVPEYLCSITFGMIRNARKALDASPKGGSTDAEPMFYIQDTRSFVGNCPMWWAPNGAGYVTRLDEAGRFTEQEAIQQNRTRDTDVPWPCAEIDKLGRLTVDHQHMRPRRERLAELKATSAEVGA